MSDTSSTPQPMPAQVQIQINAQYTKDFSFENPNAPASLQPKQSPPQIAVNVDVSATKIGEGDLYEVSLKVNADAKSESEQMFLAELTYSGLFTLKGVPAEHVSPMLLIECPRLLFPFARNIISDATRDGGFAPLLIQPVDFAAMYRQTAEIAQAAKTEGNA